MKILNIHQREFEADPSQAGALIDSLSSMQDKLWPNHLWPRMAFDRPLTVGAKGGHGPIRYFVEEYSVGKSIKFRFTSPKGFNGFHAYEIVIRTEQSVILRNRLEMNTSGLAIFSWPLIYRPLHDALIEDSLTKAQLSLGLTQEIRAWSPWVKIFRWIVSGGKAHSQVIKETHSPTNP